MRDQSTTTGSDIQTDLDRLIGVCRLLADQLNAYAVSAETFDEESFIACDRAESLLLDVRTNKALRSAERTLGRPAAPQMALAF